MAFLCPQTAFVAAAASDDNDIMPNQLALRLPLNFYKQR